MVQNQKFNDSKVLMPNEKFISDIFALYSNIIKRQDAQVIDLERAFQLFISAQPMRTYLPRTTISIQGKQNQSTITKYILSVCSEWRNAEKTQQCNMNKNDPTETDTLHLANNCTTVGG